MHLINRFFIFLINLYKKYFSPFLPQACRFTPTCSEYARGCFAKYGWAKALFLTIKRLFRCHPFCEGGFDPVP